MDAAATIREYFDALRIGEPPGEFFGDETAEEDDSVKFGISERLVGAVAIRAGLREQTETTTGWTDTERGIRHEFETRWSWMLERRTEGTSVGTSEQNDADWRFVGMHVSTAGSL